MPVTLVNKLIATFVSSARIYTNKIHKVRFTFSPHKVFSQQCAASQRLHFVTFSLWLNFSCHLKKLNSTILIFTFVDVETHRSGTTQDTNIPRQHETRSSCLSVLGVKDKNAQDRFPRKRSSHLFQFFEFPGSDELIDFLRDFLANSRLEQTQYIYGNLFFCLSHFLQTMC